LCPACWQARDHQLAVHGSRGLPLWSDAVIDADDFAPVLDAVATHIAA